MRWRKGRITAGEIILAVNRKQGKHVPVVPSEAFSLYRRLSDEIRPVYDGRRTLVIGFAETATAIGAAVAADLSALYLQTTREEMEDVSYCFFQRLTATPRSSGW